MKNRVVITGMGVVAPNAHGLDNFEKALREGISGIRIDERLADLKFACQVVGVPQNIDEVKHQYLGEHSLIAMNSSMVFGAIAAIDCWRDSGFDYPCKDEEKVDWETGAMIGTGIEAPCDLL